MSFKAGTRYSNDIYIMTETTEEGVSAVGEIDGTPIDFSGGGGSASSLEVVMTIDGEDAILNKTWQEIYDAFPNVFLSLSEEGSVVKSAILEVSQISGDYTIVVALNSTIFEAASADDYPTTTPK